MVSHEGLEPSTLWLKVRCSTNWANGSLLKRLVYLTIWKWCRQEDLNPQPTDYKSVALPIELHRQIVVARDGIEPPTHGFSVRCSTNWATEPSIHLKMAVRTGLEPATSCVTGRHSNQLNYRTNKDKFGCGGRIWTCDLRVMSPTSYRTAPPRDDIKDMVEDDGLEPPTLCL